jgi:branched-chain amino acid transport system permease protein
LLFCAGVGVFVALIIGGLSIRQRGIYFVMITLAMAQLAFFASLSFPGLTGGENGLLDVPRPALGTEGVLGETPSQYLLIAIAFVASLGFLRLVVHSPFGRALDAVRENEIRAQAVGYDVQKLKLLAFCISGGLTAVAGALYAIQLRSAPLSNIDLMTSETILIMAILGGRRSLIGAVFGALAMTLMAEQLSALWPRWQMIVGIVLIATVFLAPNGLGGMWAQLRRTRPATAKEIA